jgi:hypothetical protein
MHVPASGVPLVVNIGQVPENRRHQSISPPYRLSYILGPPVTNCNTNFSIQTSIGGTILITQQWDELPVYGPTTPFLNVDIVPSDSLPRYVNWQTTQSWMASQSVPVLLGAGQQVGAYSIIPSLADIYAI